MCWCKVTLLCLWILRSTFLNPCLLVSSRSLPLFVPLIFSASPVNKLWVYNCLEPFLCFDPFGLIWSFLWLFSQVLVHLVSICSFLVLVCREWRLISWTRILVLHHGLAFSSLISFLVFLFSSSMRISFFGPSSSLSSSLVILFIHSVFSLCFFGCHIFVQIVRLLWRPVVGMFLHPVLPVVDRIFFRCFGMSFFVCFVLPFVDISLISLLSPEVSGLFLQVVLLFFLVLSFPFCSNIFQDIFVLPFRPVFVDFFICVSNRISHPGFDSFFVLFEGVPIFSHTNFAPA